MTEALNEKASKTTGWTKKCKLLYFFHIFAKYWPIFTIFFTSRVWKTFATQRYARHTFCVATAT